MSVKPLCYADNLAYLRGWALKLGYWHLHRADGALGCRLRFFVTVRTAHDGLDIAAVLLVDLSTVLLSEGGRGEGERFDSQPARRWDTTGGGRFEWLLVEPCRLGSCFFPSFCLIQP